MAVDITKSATHTSAYPSKVLASRVGHTYNIELTTAADNGSIIGRGAYISFDRYAEATAPDDFAGKIVEQAANGNWYVEVTEFDPQEEALFVYETPIFTREDRDLRQEKLWYNAAGEVVECIVLTLGDIIEVSAEGFNNTPVAGKAVSVVDKKFTVAS